MEGYEFYLGPGAMAYSSKYDAQLAEAGVTRSVIHANESSAVIRNGIAWHSSVTCKKKIGGGEWEDISFYMQDGTQPYGLELAIQGLKAGDKVACVLQGKSALSDLDVTAGERRDGADTLSVQCEIVSVDEGWGEPVAMCAHAKCQFGKAMNELGKKLYAAKDFERAQQKFHSAAVAFNMREPETGGVIYNPQGKANNEKCFKIARLVYYNLAQLMYVKKDYKECELYCDDVLETNPGADQNQIRAKTLYRRGCARIELGKWSHSDKDIRHESAEADLLRAHDLNPEINIDAPLRLIDEKRAQRAAKEAVAPNAAAAQQTPEESMDTPGEECLEHQDGWKYYGIVPFGDHTDVLDVLQTIREENIDHVLDFCSAQERDERVAERTRFYNDLLKHDELGVSKCSWLR
jgi:tetratricopeptide (TPR) repeat protein